MRKQILVLGAIGVLVGMAVCGTLLLNRWPVGLAARETGRPGAPRERLSRRSYDNRRRRFTRRRPEPL